MKQEFYSIVSEGSKIENLGSGFQLTEGPLWNASEDYLLFSDIYANRIYKWSSIGGVSLFRELSGNSNGLTYDQEGRLIICEHSTRRVSRIDEDGTYTILADRFHDLPLNSPNDVVVKSDGMIYFTDPPYGIKPEEQELPFQGVFVLNPKKKKLELLVDDFNCPNGLAFSPDETVLYIADSSLNRRHIRVFDVKHDGTLSNSHVFAEIRSELPGNPDGIKVDIEGHLYVAAASGVWVFNEEGEHLGIISIPDPRPTNCAWGEEDWRSLFITARISFYRIRLKIPGIKTPNYKR